MRILNLDNNDMINAEGVAVSVWVAGCPHHCDGCHNPQSWSFENGFETDREVVLNYVLNALDKNGVTRGLSILGGEPCAPQNIEDVEWLIHQVRWRRPQTNIILWTGYTYEELKSFKDQTVICHLLKNIDKLVEGRYNKELRDITLQLRGSSNQRIFIQPHPEAYRVGYLVEEKY